jgi:hypothetical protein
MGRGLKRPIAGVPVTGGSKEYSAVSESIENTKITALRSLKRLLLRALSWLN